MQKGIAVYGGECFDGIPQIVKSNRGKREIALNSGEGKYIVPLNV